MTVCIAAAVGPAAIDVAYETFGEPGPPPLLLIMGVGAQQLGWPDGFCEQLPGRGLQVVRFDNRDVGLSSHVSHAPVPDLAAAQAGDQTSERAEGSSRN